MKCSLTSGVKKLVIILLLILCSITMMSCREKSGSFKQKDGTDANSINMIVPGKGQITFNETGKYTIYLQTKGNSDGKYYSIQENDINDLSVKIYNNDGPIDVKAPMGETTMTLGSDEFEGIFKFEINKPGTYTLESNLNSVKIQQVSIRLEKSNAMLSFILKIFLAIILVVVVSGIIIGIVLFCVLKNKRKKKEAI